MSKKTIQKPASIRLERVFWVKTRLNAVENS